MTNHRPLPPLERLNELFEVVPIEESQFGKCSGLVRRIDRKSHRAGSVAGSTIKNRDPERFDWLVGVDRDYYLASRIIYFMVNGVDPGDFEVDHEDQNSLNNNAKNLRLGDRSMQVHNQRMKSNNTSGAAGVFHSTPKGKWISRLINRNTRIYLGRFICKIEAARAYNDKVIELELDKIGKPLNNLVSIECDCVECSCRLVR